jgi:hypothetical protein
MVKLSVSLKVLLLFTVSVTILFSYTIYLWVGVANALRKMDVEIQRVDFKVRGDVNNDGAVDILDLEVTALALGSAPGDSSWNPDADLDQNNLVDIFDIVFDTQDRTFTVDVSALVSNPSDFRGWVTFIAIKAYQADGHWGALNVNTHPGSFRFLRPPREVRMGLNESVRFSFQIDDDLSSLGSEAVWQLTIRVHVLTIFTLEMGNIVELNLQRSYSPTPPSGVGALSVLVEELG